MYAQHRSSVTMVVPFSALRLAGHTHSICKFLCKTTIIPANLLQVIMYCGRGLPRLHHRRAKKAQIKSKKAPKPDSTLLLLNQSTFTTI